MPTPVLENGFRAQLLWSAQPGGRPWSTKFDYVQLEGASTEIDEFAIDFATKFEDEFVGTTSGELRTFFAQGTELEVIRCYKLTDPLQGIDVTPLSIKNGTSVNVLPAEVAVVASLRTKYLGRRYRGRQYWGGLGTTAVTSSTGEVAAGFRTALANFISDMTTVGQEDRSYALAVISGQGSTLERPPGLATEVEQVIVDRYPDTQRRRGAR